MKNRTFLKIISSLYLLALVLGVINSLDAGFSQISWIFGLLGIYIWGDALIIGPVMIAACIWLWFRDKSVWTGLYFTGFATIRALSEVTYTLNLQFSETMRPWEAHWQNLWLVHKIGRMEVLIIWQVGFTFITVASLLGFVYFLKMYLKDK